MRDNHAVAGVGRRQRAVVGVVVATALLGGCATVGDVFPHAADAVPRMDALVATGTDVAPPAAPEPAEPACVPAPLEQRAAAVLVVGLPGVTAPDDALAQQVVDLGVGGVFLSESNVRSAAQVATLSAGLRERAARPLLVSTDEESGRVAVTRAIVGAGPSPRRLAAMSTAEVQAYAAGLGARLAEVGVDLDLAPLLDLDDGAAGGVIGDRSFSADPATASRYGLAFAAGLQDAGVTPTVKHFPGQGRATDDTHAGSAVVTTPLAELRTTDLLPFQDAVDAGVPVVMLNHVQYEALDPALPASLSPAAYALLREMGFEGVAMTDSIGMGAVNVRWDFPVAAVLAVGAGADAVLATDGNQAVRMRDALVAAVHAGELPEGRLSEAAARVTALAGGDARAMSCLDPGVPGRGGPGETGRAAVSVPR
ncbi:MULTISPECIES: glycoside hydrolase family 3 N-terminal domain-containing protein [unclassified Actinotalea]|uniref:glycoside hydrolase family 3 N-terminal domain-containing protein n=1 Tax=unclassified Actinotalea TaxID=2638618 RepID=UPI0015F4DB3B|nr:MULTISPECIES: glycoside hydrolase family 3 N-terminal domain-containing protein [unclassified Actinotalea]